MKDYSSERTLPIVQSCVVPLKKKAKLKIVFSGETLQLQGGSAFYSYKAVSGQPGKFKPIPKSKGYWVQPSELWERNISSEIKLGAAYSFGKYISEDEKYKHSIEEFIQKHRDSWGNARLTIHVRPGFISDVGSRGGFFIHGGTTYGSAGCIDLGPKMLNFVEDLAKELGKKEAECFIDLVVK